jgi:hypothetical protein
MSGTTTSSTSAPESKLPKVDEPTPVPVRPAPHYTIVDHEESKSAPIRILMRGCEGEGTEAQRTIAAFWNEKCKELKPHWTVTAGDMIYTHGATSPIDPNFKTMIHDMYTADTICFQTLGNHDLNLCRKGLQNGNVDPSKAEHFLKHTILSEGKEDPRKIAILKGTTFDTKEMLAAGMRDIMPAPFYSYENRGVLFCHANSNKFAKDFLELYERKSEKDPWVRKTSVDPLTNQAAWLEEKIKNSPRPVIVIWHAPLVEMNKIAK